MGETPAGLPAGNVFMLTFAPEDVSYGLCSLGEGLGGRSEMSSGIFWRSRLASSWLICIIFGTGGSVSSHQRTQRRVHI